VVVVVALSMSLFFLCIARVCDCASGCVTLTLFS
jgi:hypothetical protein